MRPVGRSLQKRCQPSGEMFSDPCVPFRTGDFGSHVFDLDKRHKTIVKDLENKRKIFPEKVLTFTQRKPLSFQVKEVERWNIQ